MASRPGAQRAIACIKAIESRPPEMASTSGPDTRASATSIAACSNAAVGTASSADALSADRVPVIAGSSVRTGAIAITDKSTNGTATSTVTGVKSSLPLFPGPPTFRVAAPLIYAANGGILTVSPARTSSEKLSWNITERSEPSGHHSA